MSYKEQIQESKWLEAIGAITVLSNFFLRAQTKNDFLLSQNQLEKVIFPGNHPCFLNCPFSKNVLDPLLSQYACLSISRTKCHKFDRCQERSYWLSHLIKSTNVLSWKHVSTFQLLVTQAVSMVVHVMEQRVYASVPSAMEAIVI